MHSSQHAWTIATHSLQDQRKPYRRLQAVQNAAARLTTNARRCEHITPVLAAAATLASNSPTCAIQDRLAGVQGTTRPPIPAYLAEYVNLCLSLDADDCGPRTSTCAGLSEPTHVLASFIRCCWTSCMEQSANPAARVGHYTRTILTSTQSASIWSLTCRAEGQCFSCAVY